MSNLLPIITTTKMSQDSANGSGKPSTAEAAGQSPLKKQIDPLELLNCLSILLNSKGAIKSIDEVQRVAGLMGKYSKKLVSKCIYLNILQATEEPLLDEFYKETGWNLVCAWLTEAMATKNYPLAQQILSLLLVSPVTIDRLKRNNMPTMVKDLSKECPHAGARETAENVVQRWKELVKGYTSEGPSAVNRETSSSDSHSENVTECVRVSVTNPVPLNIVSHVSAIVVNNKNCLDGRNSSDSTERRTDNSTEGSVLSEPAVGESSPVPKIKVSRGRGSPGRVGLRGVGRGRARRKRGTTGRGRGKSLISYAELLCQDIDSTCEEKDSQGSSSNSSSTEEENSTNPPTGASVPPLRITIRNGVKVLPADTKSSPNKEKRKRVSIDSTDSDDNKPLSIILDERHKTEDDAEGTKPSLEDQDNNLPLAENGIRISPVAKAKEIKNDDDDEEVVVKAKGKGKRRILVYNSDEDEDEKQSPKKMGGDTEQEMKGTETEPDKKKKKEEEKTKSKELGEGDKGKIKDIEKKKDKKNAHFEKPVGKIDKEKEEEDRKSKDKDKLKDREKNKERSKHKESKDKDRDRSRDKDRDRDKIRDKDRDRDRDRDRDKNRDKNRDKDRDRDKNRDKNRDKDRRRDSDDKDRNKEQAEKDKATLDKVKPLSAEGMGKIPRKPASSPKVPQTTPVSFLDALGSADSELESSKRSLLVKTKSRGFRNTGLLDDEITPPGVAGKRTALPPEVPKRQVSSSTSTSASDLFDNKKTLKAPSSAPPSGDRPGGVKLISPKRPTLSDDGGFMAALTAAGTDRKKIVRKRKSSDSEPKPEGNQKILKTDPTKDSKEPSDDVKIEEEMSSPKTVPEDEDATKPEEKVTNDALLSPTSIKPTFNFYKETLSESSEKEEPAKVNSDEEEEACSEPEVEAAPEADVEDDTTEKAPSNDVTKDDDKMEIDEPDDVDTKEEPMELADGGDGEEDSDSYLPFGEKEESMERDGECDSNFAEEAPVPAPTQEDYEKVEVTFTPTKDLKGVLVYHRTKSKKKKVVKWKADSNLKEIFFFPMDETERVNVNTIKFNEMMMMEKAGEKELMFGKNKNRLLSPRGNFGILDTGMPNTCIDYGPYKLYPVHLPNSSDVTPGYKSREKHVQAQRELNTMASFFHPSMRPDTPKEPDPEMVQRIEPIIIPLKDVTGSDSICDNRSVPWPEPLFTPPPEFPFMGNAVPHQVPPPPQSGGHWVLGNHTVPRFSGGPSMFGGPVGPQGPAANPPGYGPPPPQGYPGEIRGGWGGPTDFGGPPVLLPNGPPMGMPPVMGGPPNHGMHGGPPMQGGPGPGPGMGMGGGPPPSMGNRDDYHRYNRRGGGGGGSGNWGGPQGSRGYCKHFRHGNCRHGDDCKFLHVPS